MRRLAIPALLFLVSVRAISANAQPFTINIGSAAVKSRPFRLHGYDRDQVPSAVVAAESRNRQRRYIVPPERFQRGIDRVDNCCADNGCMGDNDRLTAHAILTINPGCDPLHQSSDRLAAMRPGFRIVQPSRDGFWLDTSSKDRPVQLP